MYGKVFGYYEGSKPVLVVADLDMVREILVKQFQKFEERNLIFDNTKDPYATLVESAGEKWKRVRDISSPTFSGKKMKIMIPLVLESINKLMERMNDREKESKDFDIREDFKCLSMDVVASTAFSYDTDVFNTKNSIFMKQFDLVFDNLDPEKMPYTTLFTLMLFRVFPNLADVARLFNPRITAFKIDWFLDLAKKMITDRQSTGEVRHDYMQLMLNALKNNQTKTAHDSESDSDLSDNDVATKKRKDGKANFLTMEEMQAQVVTFLGAGYETIATTLTWIAYYLALYPDVQVKLQEEIDQYFPLDGANVNYETVPEAPYLEMVFCEVSRLAYVGQLSVQRTCTQTTKVGDVTIPKGAQVAINLQKIHYDPDLWGPEPVEQLVPGRFLPERKGGRHPMAYLPFGGGPRKCIGMRFAIMVTKMTLIKILQKFNILRCVKTKVPLKIVSDGSHAPAEEVFVKVQRRK